MNKKQNMHIVGIGFLYSVFVKIVIGQLRVGLTHRALISEPPKLLKKGKLSLKKMFNA